MDALKFLGFRLLVRSTLLISDFKALALVVVVLPVVLFGLLAAFPAFASTASIDICRQCGIVKKDTTITCLNVPYAHSQDFIHADHVKSRYEIFIGDEHEHRWVPGYLESKSGTLLDWQAPIRKVATSDKYPMYQLRLTEIALSMADFLRYSRPEFRKELFDALLNSSTEKDFFEVCSIYDMGKARQTSTAGDVWGTWLERKKTAMTEGKRLVNNSIPPGWAYRGNEHPPPASTEDPEGIRSRPSDHSRSWFYLWGITDSAE